MKTLIVNSGIGLVAQERQEQITKHGYSIEDDVKFNTDNQLIRASIFVLNDYEVTIDYPETWNQEYKDKVMSKSRIEQLAIVGAWICAEIDRLTLQEKENGK